MSVLTDLIDDIRERLGRQDELEDRVAALEEQAAALPHVIHTRTEEPNAPPESQASYTGIQMQRTDGSLGAEFVYDERDDHVELYTDRNGRGHRTKRLSIEAGMEDTILNYDTSRGHKERIRVKEDGIYQSWLLDNVNYDGHSVLTEEYDPQTGQYVLWCPKTGEVLFDVQAVPEEDL